MMNRIYVNMLLQNIGGVDEHLGEVVRIVWIDDSNKHAAFIKRFSKDKVYPQIININEIQELIDIGVMREIEDKGQIVMREDKIPEKYKEIRDREYEIVQYLWESDEPEILFVSHRRKSIEEAAKKFNVSKSKVERTIMRFLQRGMTQNALLPDYFYSGGRGKTKSAGELKRGRPRKYSYDKNNKNGEISQGINITKDIEDIIRKSIDMYYREKGLSLQLSYESMLKKFFSDKKYINGEEKPIVWDCNRIPSKRQFLYIFEKYEKTNVEENTVSRYGQKEFDLKERQRLSNSLAGVYGPGSRFEIDATLGDVHLVSTIDRSKIIGRPVIYSVIDVYSRLIVGVYVGLEGPSWLGAMMALYNTCANKVELCRSYGIEITKDEWPNEYLPECILADRGEFEGYNVGSLINSLRVRVENTSPGRGDLKGTVESRFRTINDMIKSFIPGAIKKEYRHRGDEDYRKFALLNIYEMNQVVIQIVRLHNKSVIKDYPRERAAMADDVEPVPIELWNWGVKNRACNLKKVGTDILMLNLMPRANASISRDGIKFKGMYYSAEEAIKEQWFIKGNNIREIAYDPRNMNYIYMPDDYGTSYIKCYMLEKSYAYKDLAYDEVVYLQELELRLEYGLIAETNQNKVNFITSIENIVKEAAQDSRGITSSDKSVKNIGNQRHEEKELLRREEAFELGSKPGNNINVIENEEDDEDTNSGDKALHDFIKRKGREKKHESNK
jgi:transposase